jgi:hypothetical protein
VSIVAQGVDFHAGQALGFLRHFIEVYGVEEGPQLYLEVLAGCQTHLKASFGKVVMHSEASWYENALPDDMDLTHATPSGGRVPVDGSIWSSLSPEHRKNKMKALAYRRFDEVTSVGIAQEDVDFALGELSRMSAPLKRWVMWLTRTAMKSLAIPAYSRMQDHILQATKPEVDMSANMASHTTSPGRLARDSTVVKQAFTHLRQHTTLASSVAAVNEVNEDTGSKNLLRLKTFSSNPCECNSLFVLAYVADSGWLCA